MAFDQLRKVHSLTLDTNVLLDLPEAPEYLTLKTEDEKQKSRKNRIIDSYQIAVLCLAENIGVKKIGIKIVEKELLKSSPLLTIFYSLFSVSEKPDRHAKKLANSYISRIGLKPADALIVATASVKDIDVILTWNRKDLANNVTRNKIEQINKAAKVNTPLVCDPTYFIDRLVGSEGKTKISLALNPSPVPKAYRLRFFPSR